MALRIQLVDDNPVFLAAIRQFIESMPNAEVVALSSDGEQALQAARELQPDVVVLDIAMPRKSGLQVATEMMGWENRPKVLILSSHNNSSYRNAAREAGAAAFVTKSDFVTQLVPMLEKLANEAEPGPAPA